MIPNLSPVDAIKLLGRRALPTNLNDRGGAGYLFYETPKGFHFRSFASLCVTKSGEQVKPEQKFRYVHVPVDTTHHEIIEDGKKVDKIMENFRSVESYKFVNTFHDVASNTAIGTYGHTVITHNLYDKSYKKDKYHYHNSFDDTGHADNNGGYDREASYTTSNPMIVSSPVDYDLVEGDTRQKGVSDFAESRVSLQATSQYTHGEDTGSYGVDVAQDGVLEGERVSLANQLHSGTRLQLTIKGQAWLQAGDLIQFDMQTIENRDDRPSTRLDPQLSGRYIISHIRHRVAGDQYRQVLECVKDSVVRSFGTTRKAYAEIAGEEKTPVSPSDIDNYA